MEVVVRIRCIMNAAGERDVDWRDEWSRLYPSFLGCCWLVDLILLAVLNRGPAHRVDWGHDSTVICIHLHVLIKGFLNQLDPMEMDSRWIDGVVLVDRCESKLYRFFDQRWTFGSRLLLTLWSRVHWTGLVRLGYRRCPPPPSSGGAAGGLVMVSFDQYNSYRGST